MLIKKYLYCSVLLLMVVAALDARLIDVYKKGVLKLEPDPEFGKGITWSDYFFDEHKDIVVGPDGSVFVINSPDHNIFKFGPKGRLEKTFGEKRRGARGLIPSGRPVHFG